VTLGPTVEVAVIGGGITGLAAAFELQQRGIGARLLEASSRLGGVIVTERFDGWVVDGGPDALLVQKPAGVGLCREIGLADRLIPTLIPRTAYVFKNERLHPLAEGAFLGFPLRARALAASSLFSWPGKFRMALEALIPRGNPVEDESIATFVRRRFGLEAVEYLAEPLLAGIHAGDVDRLSMRVLFPMLLEAERKAGSVIRGLRAMRRPSSSRGPFVSLPGGIGELVDTLAAVLHPGTLHQSARVTDVHRAGVYTIDSSVGPVQARAVILAVPAYVAAGLLRGVDTALAGICDGVTYASTATIALGYRRDQVKHPLRGSGFVVPRREQRPLLASTWVTSKWPSRAPEGCVLLRGFVGGARDPRRLERSDDELVGVVQSELTGLLDISGSPLFARVFRWTRQSPQYEVGHLHRLASIDERLASVPGLFLAGSGFRAIGIPDCIADGREAAARAAAFLSSSRNC
jgi:oxygen-dependent protoporphyrinogen oxidase